MEIRSIRNKLFCIVVLLFIVVPEMFAFGAGIFYPRLVFSFHNVNKNFYWGAADKACDLATEKTPEINVLFRQPGNSFKAEFFPVFLTKKNYSSLYVKKIAYIYEEKEIIQLEDVKFKLSPDIISMDVYKDGWITNGTYYWMNGWDAKPENWKDKSKLWPETNFEKIFKNKKVGDEFPFKVRIVYHFDDEEEKQLDIDFIVTTLKGEYTSIFAGW
ncbi:MAG: hypothetical protein K6E22_12135 [Treponema sp.]|nr:hypothetical protein [Treponema sp.]